MTQGRVVTTLRWLEDPRPDAGLHFLEDDGTWRYLTYEDVAGRVAAMAEILRDQGLAGQRLGLVGETSENFIVQHFAVVAAGGTAVPVPFLQPGEDRDPHDRLVEFILQTARPSAVLATGQSESVVGWPAARVPGYSEIVPLGRVNITPSELPAVIRFTSGSTGVPKGVRIGRSGSDASLSTMHGWSGLGHSDRWATWLPLWRGLHHWALAVQCDLLMMTSIQFLERPERWLRCFGELGCTATGSPSFGYHHVVRKVVPETVASCRFDGWRMAGIFGEPVRASDLDEFVSAFGPLGFQRRAFCPTYGLTEAGSMVAVTRPQEEPAAWADDDLPDRNGPAEVLAEAAHKALPGDRMIGVGRPVKQSWVSIRLPDGSEAPEGALGEVWVGREPLADGYEGSEDFGDWYATGDVGGFQDGVLFIFGRLVDSFQIRGQRVLAEQAEHAVESAVPDISSVVVVPHRAEGAGMTVVAESAVQWPSERIDQTRTIVSELFKNTEVDLLVVPVGAIPRTAGGKPQRQDVWARYVSGSTGRMR